MDNLITLVEQEIVNIKNIYTNNRKFESVRQVLIKLVNDQNLLNLTSEEYDSLFKIPYAEYQFDNSENLFLTQIKCFDDETKKLLISFGFDENQKKLIESIKKKINNVIEKNNEIDLENIKNREEKCKNLLAKLKNNGLKIITEFDLVKELLDKGNVSLNNQIAIFKEINKINVGINNRINNDDKIENDIIDEDELEKTNLDRERVSAIFENYGISLDKMPSSYIEQLLTYGEYTKFEELLSFITNKSNGISFILEKYEILTRVLLHSNVSILENVVELSKRKNISKIISVSPTILFPSVAVHGKHHFGAKSKKIDTKKEKIEIIDKKEPIVSIVGAYNNFIKNIELLEQLDIPASIVFEKCATFFTYSEHSVKNVIKNLALYDMSPFDKDDISKSPFSILAYPNMILDNLDKAIEANCLNYIVDNKTRLINNDNIFNRVKLARKLHFLENDFSVPFTQYSSLKKSTKLYLRGDITTDKNSKYGELSSETYKLYGAQEFNCPNKELYDDIIGNNENNSVSIISLDDDYIKELDRLFKSNELVYDFNGVLISRKKVLRFYETLISDASIESNFELLMYVITKNSMLDSDEINNINQCLKVIEMGGYVKC